jgi:arylsulfatase A-like enzyme
METRRDFLKSAAAVAAASTVQASGQQPQSAPGGRPLNLILIVADTFRADALDCYGDGEIETPNLDRFASSATSFLEAYAEGLPTLPVRRALLTGRRVIPFRMVDQASDTVRLAGWHPLFQEDVTLAEALQKAGYTTAYFTDVYHAMKPGKNFHRGFHCWRWVRGQENDPYVSGPAKGIDWRQFAHSTQQPPPSQRPQFFQYLLNRRDWKTEEDWFVGRLAAEAERWLDDNIDNSPFFLYLDSFMPHEWWDPAPGYAERYFASYQGPRLIAPPAGTGKMSPDEVRHVQALYHGSITQVDRWLGRVLGKIEKLGLLDNSVVVFTSDHGTMMGEQQEIHKAASRLRAQVTRVPLLIRHPDRATHGRRVSGFVQHPDIMPTLMKLIGVDVPQRCTGGDVWQKPPDRQAIVTAFGYYASVRTPEWNLIVPWDMEKVDRPKFAQLYDLRSDPRELTNVIDQHPQVAVELRQKLTAYLEEGRALTAGTFLT